MKLGRDWIVFTTIYLLVLSITLHYALFNMEIVSDHIWEYKYYTQTIENGGWQHEIGAPVSSCVMTTMVPAYLYMWLPISNAELWYSVFPTFLYSLMPPFIYLIARRYLDIKYSVLAAMLPIAGFFFLFYPAIGRWGVALGFMAGMIWGLLSGRRVLAVIFGVLMVFSHYGTTYIGVSALLAAAVATLVKNRSREQILSIVLPAVIIFLAMMSWQFGIASDIGNVAKGFVRNALSQLVDEKTYVSLTEEGLFGMVAGENGDGGAGGENGDTGAVGENGDEGVAGEVAGDEVYREPVVSVAFGATLPDMNIPQKIEFAFSWIIAISLSLGLAYVLWRRILSLPHAVMAAVLYMFLFVALLVPHISMYYGVVRVYHTSLVVLSPVFVIALKALADKTKIPGYALILAILIPYGLCVSGIMHSFFGIVK